MERAEAVIGRAAAEDPGHFAVHRLLQLMDPIDDRRFVAAAEAVTELSPFTLNAWMSRPDIVPCRELLMVRATMEPGFCHPFHRHPTREEIIYVLSGQAEQWCGDRHRVLKPGEMVLIPAGEVHGTYNPFREPVVFLAILAPAGAAGPDMVDVSGEAPWVGKREGLGLPACVTRADPAVSRAPG